MYLTQHITHFLQQNIHFKPKSQPLYPIRFDPPPRVLHLPIIRLDLLNTGGLSEKKKTLLKLTKIGVGL